MKILWFSNSPVSVAQEKGIDYVGCSWIGALEYELLKRENIELAIVVPYYKNRSELIMVKNVKYFLTPVRSGRLKRKFTIRKHFVMNDEQAILDYLAIIEEYQPDIIQIFGTESNYGLLISKIRIPVLVHIQGILTLINNKFYAAISPFEVYRFSRIIDYLKGCDINRYFKFGLKEARREEAILSSCAYVMGRTEWVKGVMKIMAPQAKYFHCNEILREEFLNYQWRNHDQNIVRILSVIRPNIYKGFDVIIRTAYLLKKRGIDFIWNIAGSLENDRVVRIIKQKLKSEYSSNEIKFLGGKNAQEVIDLMKDSNFFVHPSYIENSPNSICEAMMVGMPVIATNVGGVSSLIENQKEGILLQEGDYLSMASAILELIEQPQKAKIMGQNARARAIHRHNPGKIVDTLLVIYNDILTLEKSSRFNLIDK